MFSPPGVCSGPSRTALGRQFRRAHRVLRVLRPLRAHPLGTAHRGADVPLLRLLCLLPPGELLSRHGMSRTPSTTGSPSGGRGGPSEDGARSAISPATSSGDSGSGGDAAAATALSCVAFYVFYAFALRGSFLPTTTSSASSSTSSPSGTFVAAPRTLGAPSKTPSTTCSPSGDCSRPPQDAPIRRFRRLPPDATAVSAAALPQQQQCTATAMQTSGRTPLPPNAGSEAAATAAARRVIRHPRHSGRLRSSAVRSARGRGRSPRRRRRRGRHRHQHRIQHRQRSATSSMPSPSGDPLWHAPRTSRRPRPEITNARAYYISYIFPPRGFVKALVYNRPSTFQLAVVIRRSVGSFVEHVLSRGDSRRGSSSSDGERSSSGPDGRLRQVG